MNVKTIIFDLDGTLIDSKKDIVMAINKTLRDLDIPTLPEDDIIPFMSYGPEVFIKQCIGEKNADKFERAFEKFKENYSERCIVYTSLFPGVREVLEFLKERKINIALATNKMMSLSKKILQHFGLEKYFSIMLGPEDVTNKKPHPEIIEIILQKLNVKREEALYVGDSEIDVLCGKSAGVYTCAVTYGIGDIKSIIAANPDFIITDLTKLILLVS
ncbi:HAD family hydrolase [Thermoanaerobacter wiegelii]|uniref:HAD-superfamily hydrolase, subfamily IA, variant 1 n=1 Tax=Thermoanaerobacter wiegelii Rt8.B1 TaxID=697303 RepID=G2MVK2_9THEO|nr:HAD-IA family hydrolase [Thermoanaerobacter wiegelii]AEM79130.1 HAD-superfamily hydrolase, subfamily IA, variant 1 [Thermoanaerobacter wiegelii Rt8.B1]